MALVINLFITPWPTLTSLALNLLVLPRLMDVIMYTIVSFIAALFFFSWHLFLLWIFFHRSLKLVVFCFVFHHAWLVSIWQAAISIPFLRQMACNLLFMAVVMLWMFKCSNNIIMRIMRWLGIWTAVCICCQVHVVLNLINLCAVYGNDAK